LQRSHSDQFIFQRRTPAPTEPLGHEESSSLYAELGLTDSETEADDDVPSEINPEAQDEGQAGPNPGKQVKGQAGSDPGDAADSQPQPSHVVHAGPNLKHMDFEATDASSQRNSEHLDEEFTTTAYPNVQENLKLPTEDQVRLKEPASSAGTLSSLQNLDKEFSFTNQFLEEKSQEDEPEKTNAEAEVQSMVTVLIHQDTSSVPLMTTPVIDLTVSQPVPTTVQAPLPTSIPTVTAITTTTSLPPPPPHSQQRSTESILVQCMGELEQHIADLVQVNLALEERIDKHETRLYKLENLDIPHKVSQAVDEIVTDAVDWAIQALLRDRFRDFPEADMKDLHTTLCTKKEEKETRSDQSKGIAAPSSSKTTLSAKYTAWMTIDTRLRSSVSSTPDDLNIDNDSVLDTQKPLYEEDRPATPEPAWSIPSSDLPVPMHNWASALASTYAPPPENSLLAQTGDMATFMDWYYKKQGITELTQKDLEGPAFEIVKVFHPDVIHLKYKMEECHKLLTYQVDNAILKYNVSKPLPLGGP
ncbi:hypothetical protein Tco_0942985, partial [Tanacetum coccineum]